jgi:hypothetical protein
MIAFLADPTLKYMSAKNVKVVTATMTNVAVADAPIVEARNVMRLEKSTLDKSKNRVISLCRNTRIKVSM